MTARSVLIVDDEVLLREMVTQLLQQAGFRTLTAANSVDAIGLFRRSDPDAVIIDIDLGIGPDGLQLAEAITRESPGTALVFLTNLPHARLSPSPSPQVLNHVAYLRKSQLSTSNELVLALNAALGERVTAAQRHDQFSNDALSALSAAQLEVLRMVSEGLSNEQIAEARHTSIRSVERLISRILETLSIDPQVGNSRVRAARAYLLARPR